ncbi:MAG: MFS transporter [Chloroflexi bacterium]|nr:MFS transporter [Chloroflexota bacterium]
MEYSGEVDAGEAPLGWRAAVASLQHRQFRWLYASNVAFFFAMNGQFLVRSILAYKLTDSAVALGLVNLFVAVPMLVISPIGGVIADRVEKRRLIIAGQAVLVVNEAAVFTLMVTGYLAFWHLLAVAFVMGCAFPFIMPARQSIVASIVGREGLGNALALQMGGMNAARVAAPALAGFVVARAGIEPMYVIAIALYLVALLSMSRVDKAPGAMRKAGSSMFGELVEGVRYVRNDPPVRVLMFLSLVPILFAMPFQALLVVFADDVWKTGASGLGLLQAVAGFGGILGSVYVAWQGATNRPLRLMMASLLGFAGALFLFALSPWFLLALPLVLLTDVFASVFNTVNSTAVNLLIPDHVRGRVMSLMMMTFGLTPLGTLPVSAAADAWGAPAAVAGTGVLMAVVSVAIYFLSPSLRAINESSKRAYHAERGLAEGIPKRGAASAAS